MTSTLPYPIRAKIGVFRLLDQIGHTWRVLFKSSRFYRKYGPAWRDSERPGRRFVRTRYIADRGWFQLQTPGWEWICPNCKEYSLILETDMPRIIEDWKKECFDMRLRGFERNIQPMPEAKTARCPNCHFRPGAPE